MMARRLFFGLRGVCGLFRLNGQDGCAVARRLASQMAGRGAAVEDISRADAGSHTFSLSRQSNLVRDVTQVACGLPKLGMSADRGLRALRGSPFAARLPEPRCRPGAPDNSRSPQCLPFKSLSDARLAR